MTLQEYQEKIGKIGFNEVPNEITGREKSIEDVVNYEEANLELKIHLAEVIICRCFPPTRGICFNDHRWFIENFLRYYENDIPKPWLTVAIREAIEMILSKDVFTKGIIGTTFMFGVVEFYAKYFLGYYPMKLDPFDEESHNKFRDMFIHQAFNKLRRSDKRIARSLNAIDKYNKKRLKKECIEKRRIKARIEERLILARNAMLHGENHSFYDQGPYLIMLYILFHLHDWQSK